MSYPQYLSAKSLEKRYREAGISENKICFLKDFCLACVNLYGAIHADQLWDVYRELAGKTSLPKIHRKELYTALGIFRREDLPYFVFEADEVYDEEPRADKYRLLVSKKLIHSGYGKLRSLYTLIDVSLDKPYYVPEDLLTYKDPPADLREQELIRWLSELSCTQTEFESSFGKTFPCVYTGKKLGEFSFISREDDFELRYQRGEIEGRKGNAKYADELEKELHSMTAAQRLVHDYKWRSHLGWAKPTDSLTYLMNDLTEMGVLLTEEETDHLIQSLMEYHNHLHLWCNCGWTPAEMAEKIYGSGGIVPKIQFGPGMQKAFAEGALDKEELVRKLKEMGLRRNEPFAEKGQRL